MALETKTEMKKYEVSSPDRADAVFGAMVPLRILGPPLSFRVAENLVLIRGASRTKSDQQL